ARAAAVPHEGPRGVGRARLEHARARVLPLARCRAGGGLDDVEAHVTTTREAQFPPMPANRLAVWENFGKWDTEWFPKFMGIEVEALRQDYARMRMTYRPHLQQPAGVVHGGVIATMVDTCVVPALGSGYDEPRQLFTIDISLRFLAPIINEDIVAEGWIVQRG